MSTGIFRKTFLQSRILNRGKGPAVHSLRAQIDRVEYHKLMKKTIEGESEPQTEEYREGSSVEHNLFGRGLVLSIDDGIALIDFEGLGKKRISLAHCKAMRVI